MSAIRVCMEVIGECAEDHELGSHAGPLAACGNCELPEDLLADAMDMVRMPDHPP